MIDELNIFDLADNRLQIQERLNRRLFVRGRTLQRESYVSHVPDRYSAKYQKYLAGGGSFGKHLVEKFIAGNRYNNSGDLSRFFFLSLACDQLLKEGIRGDAAELGVYRGNTGIFLAKLAEQTGGHYYTAGDAKKLAREISFSEAGITQRETKEIWDMPVVFLLVFSLKATEWLLRRRWGVV